jgi:DnaJ like chaperone protein
MLLIVFCAFFGFWLGGTRGLVMGLALGYLLQRGSRGLLGSATHTVHAQFIESTFAVAGAISKADGVVTQNEIQTAEALFVRLKLSESQIGAAKSAFNRGKAIDFQLDAEVDRFAQVARRSAGLLQMFLQVQMATALADGQVHPAEQAMLMHVARRLGLNSRDIAQLEALLRYASQATSGSTGGPPPQRKIADAYAVLGVTPEASATEIKRAYRKLISENHPDKLASKGLPEGMRALSEERARDINAAYELIKKSRDFA